MRVTRSLSTPSARAQRLSSTISAHRTAKSCTWWSAGGWSMMANKSKSTSQSTTRTCTISLGRQCGSSVKYNQRFRKALAPRTTSTSVCSTITSLSPTSLISESAIRNATSLGHRSYRPPHDRLSFARYWREQMRMSFWAFSLGTALAFAVQPAEAAWHSYFVKEGVGFSFTAPGEIKAEKTTYRSALAGQRNAVVFGSVEDNVEYKITVVDFAGRASDESALIKEATAASQDRTKVLMDEDARVESSYGRKLTVDLPNNSGRSMSAIFFKDDHLIQ